jgi:hypothetical protein
MDATIDWLMQGDPAIRWQTERDLLDAPARRWQRTRRETSKAGWGAQLLALQDRAGTWAGAIYDPKWTSTIYTLLGLISIGVPPTCASARRGPEIALSRQIGERADTEFRAKARRTDRCVVGMVLAIAVYFRLDTKRIAMLRDDVLDEALADGGWNCRRGRARPEPTHSSFNTTFNVLDGLREYIERGSGARLDEVVGAERKATEFMLAHRLYKSHRTGSEIDPRFALMSFPPRWHYDALRGLDYFARANVPRDARFEDAIALLRGQRSADGTWPLQHQYSGKVYFAMEKLGKPSRWNTLRALRVLRWWEAGRATSRKASSREGKEAR